MMFGPGRRPAYPKGTKVVELTGIPKIDVGAPIPTVVGNEYRLSLLYHLPNPHPDWDGTNPRVVGPDSEEPIACIRFGGLGNHRLGEPDENALFTHPLYELGLRHYGAFEIIHPRRKGPSRHLFLTFHDSSFEVEACDYTVHHLGTRSLIQAAKTELDEWIK